MRNAKSQMGNLTFANLIDFSNYVLFFAQDATLSKTILSKFILSKQFYDDTLLTQ